MQKVEIIKFLKALVCELEKDGNVCILCFMLVHVFVILVSIEIMRGIIFDVLSAFKYVCKGKPLSAIFKDYFLC